MVTIKYSSYLQQLLALKQPGKCWLLGPAKMVGENITVISGNTRYQCHMINVLGVIIMSLGFLSVLMWIFQDSCTNYPIKGATL